MAELPTNSSEPRALTAALSGPMFQTRNSAPAMHAATRHVERWAPEAGANRVRSLKTLGFVDRLAAPWLEVAQRSASMRLFQQYRSEGMPERQPSHVSWVFPRPWYQDELDWMTASREAAAQQAMLRQQGEAAARAQEMFTTRGTYVSPSQRTQVALPAALYEHVAPSLSIAPPMRGDGAAPAASFAAPAQRVFDAYSPLVPFAAVNAAQVMQRAVAPLIANREASAATMSPGLRAVLSGILERSAMAPISVEPTRSAANAPELVTPPAPRPDADPIAQQAEPVVESVSQQRAQIVELQRAAQIVAQRQIAERTTQVERVRQEQLAASEAARVAAANRTAASEQTSRADERARVEDRIAQRLAERQQQQEAQQRAVEAAQQQQRVVREQQVAAHQQRLHESAREQAARDAANAPIASTSAEVAPIAAPQQLAVPVEITAALANLSPQLASVVATNLATRPERAAQTIHELNDALRSAELIARTAAAGRQIEQTRGPRLVMPAGLGGLVATVDQNVAAQQQAQRAYASMAAANASPAAMSAIAASSPEVAMIAGSSASTMPRAMTAGVSIAPRPSFAPTFAQMFVAPTAGSASSVGSSESGTATSTSTSTGTSTGFVSAMRMPAMAWLAAAEAQGISSTTALGATESAVPAALSHVAWADRWLARFSGAREQSLDLLAAASAPMSTRLQLLADAAPGTVFVAPQFDHSIDNSPAAIERRNAEAPQHEAPVRRFDDNEATPDDMFLSISRQVARTRAPVVSVPEMQTADRLSVADAVAQSVPVAPAAGLQAQLASSPFAPAFRHVFPIAAAPAFDVRALFGETLSAAYLAGVLSPSAREVTAGAAIGEVPGLETFAAQQPFAPIAREAIEWSPSYVAPVDPIAPTAAAGEELAPEQVAAYEQQIAAQQQAQQQIEHITTMRSALLSWNVESIVTPDAQRPQMAQAPIGGVSEAINISAPELAQFAPQTFVGNASLPIGQSMVDAMTLPMVGDMIAAQQAGSIGAYTVPFATTQASTTANVADSRVPTFAAPGMIAERAQAWSVAQERSSADLSFDFVTPELVLAARVYGLGPAEAAQAMRLAIAGPGQLATMASTVNRTFVQAMAIEAERQGSASIDPITGVPISGSGSGSRSGSVAGMTAYPTMAPMSAGTSYGTLAGPIALPDVTTTFGVDRRAPRGAFMWPSATVAALGLSAAAPDGEQNMPVAALELLAAQSVAALGTYAALGFGLSPAQIQALSGDDSFAQTEATTSLGSRAGSISQSAPEMTSVAPSAIEGDVAAQRAAASAAQAPAEASEADVMTAASAMVSQSRRAKFEAMYVALGQSAQARSWSPAAKAARALALAGRGDETITSLERAQIAWSVLPLVAPTMLGHALGVDADEPGAVVSTGTAQQRDVLRRRAAELAPENLAFAAAERPGLSPLSSRAGEALASYVAPEVAAPRNTASSGRGEGPSYRAPTAQPDYVNTASSSSSSSPVRSTGRFGGGEVEIPGWFEAAAKKMFAQQNGGLGGDISLAELTLVQSAPSTHIAASERSMPSAAPANANPSTQAAQQSAHQQIDIEKVANEVYKHILTLMDAARHRNGEPYL
ncbi:MAG: hypothetical protein QM831_02505 [Kofleriaceae bacterium]